MDLCIPKGETGTASVLYMALEKWGAMRKSDVWPLIGCDFSCISAGTIPQQG